MNQQQIDPAVLRLHLQEYVESITEPRGAHYVCPLCGSGTGRNRTAAFSIKDGEKWKCFSCGKGGDLFDLIGAFENLTTFEAQHHRAIALFGVSGKASPSSRKATRQSPTLNESDFNTFIELTRAAIDQTDYLQQRGLTTETIDRFGLGYYDGSTEQKRALVRLIGYDPIRVPSIVIPYPDARYFIARPINPGDGPKYIKPKSDKAGPEPIFNAEVLYNSHSAPVFVVEGPFDAMSVSQAGGQVIATVGANHTRLIDLLKSRPTKCPLIIATDNDKTGKAEAACMATSLKMDGMPPFIKADLSTYGEIKDANELLECDPEKLSQFVAEAVLLADPRNQYNTNRAVKRLKGFIKGIDNSVDTPCIPTGFPKLDELLDGGLYEGFYVIGAVSSMGKTTYVLQMSDNIAKNGQDVLFFSLEMAANEIMAKSISRLTYELCGGYSTTAKTSRGITSGKRYQDYGDEEKILIKQAIATYQEQYAPNVYFIEGIGNIGVTSIRDTVSRHIEYTGNKPVVVIDYLQAMAPNNERATDKQNIDKAVLELKRISRDFKLPVIAISSFNRANYHGAAGLEAFKESGAIEYTADVVLAIQPEGVNLGGGNKDLKTNKKAMHDFKSKDERLGEIVILKNRNGATNKAVTVGYWAMFNHFRELRSQNYIESNGISF